MACPTFSPSQLHALFQVLTHAETFREIEDFKYPETPSKFGYPFTKDGSGGESPDFAAHSGSPILQMLLREVVLSLPPAKSVPVEFWSLRVQGIITAFAGAELSESYDKGAMGTRKTLATVASALLEVAARGCLGGCPGGPMVASSSETYDRTSARDLARAWDDTMRDFVYGDLIDNMFDFFAQNESPEAYSPRIQAAIEWLIIQ